MTDLARLTAALADRYRIEHELGAGGMATVYLAHDLKHERDVAIKVLQPDLGAALGGGRFLSEIKTTARLQHPHILPLLDSGEAGGLLYYVMPVVSGETLRARLTRERQLPIPEAVRIAREVAGALDYAHRQNVIHRDIKPENILLHDGQALVADFGIALAVQSAAGERLTQTGLSLGTPQYMSPEQAMGERTIDARSDIYALGAVTYEMLAGDAPFTGSSVQAIVAKVMAERPTPLRTVRDTVPPGVEAAVLTALAKLPADRQASAAEFSAALASPTATAGATLAVPAGLGGRRNGPALALGALAIVALLGAAWGWLRPRPQAPVVRYRIALDSVPETRDGTGALAMSPDGSVLVHAGGLSGPLMVRRRDQLAFRPMAGTEGGRSPFFSPDGRQIAFLSGSRLMIVPLDGGPAVAYADSLVYAFSPSWGADGYIYGLLRTMEPNALGLWRMAATPGAPLESVTRIDTAAGERSHTRPEPLPGGDALLFSIEYRDGRSVIAAADVRTGRHTAVVDGIRARLSRGLLLYTTRGGELLSARFDAGTRRLAGAPIVVADRLRATLLGPVDFAVSTTGSLAYVVDDASEQRELAWVARDGSVRAVDPSWRGAFGGPAISPDGTRLAVTVREADAADIWVQRTDGGPRTRVTVGNTVSQSAAWTPDGRSLTYIVSEGGGTTTGDIWSRRADGAEGPRRLLKSPRQISEQVWSPAGNRLIVRTTTGTAGAGDILAFEPARETTLTDVVASRHSEYSPTLSPDGRWMAYTSNETGNTEIYVVPFPVPGSAKWQVSTRRGYAPLWSRRGGELFYVDGDANLVAVQVTTAPVFSLGRSTVLFSAADFVNAGISRRNYDVARDDQRFLMIRRARGFPSAQVVVVENGAAEIAARLQAGR